MSGGKDKDLGRLVSSLHPLERKVLPKIGNENDAAKIIQTTGLSKTAVNRAFQWLENKGLIQIKEDVVVLAELDENGEKYLQEGLPEKRFIDAITKEKTPLSEIKTAARLSDEEVNICIGVLRKLNAITISKGEELTATKTDKGRDILNKGLPYEHFLHRQFPVDISTLTNHEKLALEELNKRKSIIKVYPYKRTSGCLTELGNKILEVGIDINVIDRLTPGMLKSGSWKGKEFRRYDLLAPVPRIFGGRKQHYRRFLEDVREKFIALGFTEMTGPVVETEFWNMDALYMPQFHSARDIHQAYYVKEPKYSKSLPKDIVMKVKAAHERGVAGSRGWRYQFDVQRTHRHVLRSQDTSISPRTLAGPELKVPGKYFQMVRCFRYDVIDATHLADFNQIGGFVVGEGINFRHLVGLLRMFAREFAEAEEIKVTPAYFPFTEPSAALYAKHPEMGWIELGGSGIFRPEMMHSLGVKEPVIAWGIGVERVAMFKLGLKDIRQLFSHDLSFLRNIKVI